ncbi:MAG: universal stress protein [Desulfobacteraceae bacterium]|jgi:nucleotide-binding universal stress UspA family protein|nr:universal stress protein [Desulfobacteraceae bacterium]
MLPWKTILCPTDFSAPSHEAIQAGVELATHFNTGLILLNVITPVPVVATAYDHQVFNVPTYQHDLETHAEAQLKNIATRLLAEAPGLTVSTRTIVFEPAYGIVQAAAEVKADLIVIATHGQSGWRRFLFGSVTEKVVKMAACPVLTIRAPEGEDEPAQASPDNQGP